MADFKHFDLDGRGYVFTVTGSRIFALSDRTDGLLTQALADADQQQAYALMVSAGIDLDETPTASAPPAARQRALSLSVAQTCNLSCGYCYASSGSFGGNAKMMSKPVALGALQRLIQGCPSGERVNVVFLGGEPLINRSLIYTATEYAAIKAAQRDVGVGFSITTNGTLLQPQDLEFFEQHGFSVTVSVDGTQEAHDAQRPFRGGQGSFERIMERVKPFLRSQRAMQVSARVTVTPKNLELLEILDALVGYGFHSVGCSPMLNAPDGANEMSPGDLSALLSQMKTCGDAFFDRTQAGRRYPFSNLVTALQQLHKGSRRNHPCGAGLGYFAVSADGALYPCHRYIEDPERKTGSVTAGVDTAIAGDWLNRRNVLHQTPCHTCWARHLCGGGCHHEVEARGRHACDYIRGWLEYCLNAYVRMLGSNPSWFDGGKQDPHS